MSSPYLTWTYGSQRNLISGQEQSPLILAPSTEVRRIIQTATERVWAGLRQQYGRRDPHQPADGGTDVQGRVGSDNIEGKLLACEGEIAPHTITREGLPWLLVLLAASAAVSHGSCLSESA
jgi:hypothetical protein